MLSTRWKFLARLSKRIPLRTLLIVPFVLQTVSAVGLTGYLSIRNGQIAIDTLALKLQQEASARIDQHLASYLQAPYKLSQLGGNLIDAGLLDSNNLEELSRFFSAQALLYDVGYVGFGSATGRYAAAGHSLSDRDINVDELNPQRYGDDRVRIYKTDSEGNRTTLATTTEYPFQQDAWYDQTVKAGRPIWTPIYQWKTEPFPLAIAATRPVYDKQHRLIGVIAVDQRLSQISEFLSRLNVSPAGKTFLIERSGLLVASSDDTALYEKVNQVPHRINGAESQNPVVQATVKHLIDRYQQLGTIQASQQSTFLLNGQRQLVQVNPWSDKLGLDWLIVVVVPESDFTAQISANTRITILLCLVALVVAIALGILTTRWIAQPILQLQQASKSLATGQMDQYVPDSAVAELGDLAQSFNQMAHQIRESFAALAQINETLELRVSDRTAALSEALQNLQKTQFQLIQTEKMSSLGRLVAGVAHEINNPVNFIYGNLKHTHSYFQDLLDTIQLYQQFYPHPVSEIQAQAEEIDLEFLVQDLPKMIVSMQVGAERIQEIVLSLRNFSRMDEAKRKTVNIHEGIDSTLMILQNRIEKSKIQLVKEYGQLPSVECYAGLLNQVFMNILVNAIDALEEASCFANDAVEEAAITQPTIWIQTEYLLEDELVQVQITDNGSGMSEAVQSKLFDPFFTTKPIGKGTGLGLSISYQIVVDQHHGSLTCISMGQGCKFVIKIPLNFSPR